MSFHINGVNPSVYHIFNGVIKDRRSIILFYRTFLLRQIDHFCKRNILGANNDKNFKKLSLHLMYQLRSYITFQRKGGPEDLPTTF